MLTSCFSEAFVNCAKVNIGSSSSGGNDPTPSKPYPSASQPERPSQSASNPQEPENEEEDPQEPITTSRVGSHPPQPTLAIVTTTVATTIYVTEPTGLPNESEDEDRSGEDAQDSLDSGSSWWRSRPHRRVQPDARRYQIDGVRCECRRDETTLAARCSCDSSENTVVRKALRLHRRTLYKRVDACDWDSAPAMETSYYTVDAKCAPNAKQDTPESDSFEIKWDVSCGVVEADTEYPLKTMVCGKSFSASIE